MHSFTSIATLLSVAALASAQGRFACSKIVNGAITPMPAMCADGTIAADFGPLPGQAGQVNGGYKRNGATPTGSSCVQDFASGNYFCGYTGAACTTAAQCDNGVCSGGTCQGGPGMTCATDSQCIGKVYCTDPNGFPTSSGVCGGNSAPQPAGTADTAATPEGAFCFDGTTTFPEQNFLCLGGYCNPATNACSIRPLASQRSRSRRSELTARGARCPASHSACSVAGKGFECVDTTSNLEQCGACASAGGVDCTALPGVDAVGCVAGKCEIWACAEGFAFDASSASCTVSLTA